MLTMQIWGIVQAVGAVFFILATFAHLFWKTHKFFKKEEIVSCLGVVIFGIVLLVYSTNFLGKFSLVSGISPEELTAKSKGVKFSAQIEISLEKFGNLPEIRLIPGTTKKIQN